MNYILLKRKKSNTVWSVFRIVSGPVPRDDNDQIYCMEIEPSAINTNTLFQYIYRGNRIFNRDEVIGVLLSNGLMMRVKVDGARDRNNHKTTRMTHKERQELDSMPDYIQVQYLRNKAERFDKTLERLRAHLAKQNDDKCFEVLLEISAWLEDHKVVSGNQTG